MKISLPARTGGNPITLNTSRLTIIGANGAGKTRFTATLAASLGGRTYKMSALRAIYDNIGEDPLPGSIDSQYHDAVRRSPLIRPDITGAFERQIALLINETALELFAEHLGDDARDITAPHHRLQTLVNNWEQIFPGNKILLTRGRMLIGNDIGADPFSTNRLSDGEKTVLYHLGAALLAPQGAVVFVDAPEMFLHPSSIRPLWDRIEAMRPDCTFVYTTHDLAFAATRIPGDIIWVKGCDSDAATWQYERIQAAEGIPEDVFLAIIGERKPVMFIEGDATHSYDARLYPLVFPEYTVKPLGSCDRVIESTRTFNTLRAFHDLDAVGIVDRDRRDFKEVEYLRSRGILVPDVAEIENIFMLEDVVKTVAAVNNREPDKAFERVKRNLLRLFNANMQQQALEHTRHRIKRGVQTRVDGKFDNIEALEDHLIDLPGLLNPRDTYNNLMRQFARYHDRGDYAAVLRVFNYKPMLIETRVAELCGLERNDRRALIEAVLAILRRRDTPAATAIRNAIRAAFTLK